jgi:hypothetical protein
VDRTRRRLIGHRAWGYMADRLSWGDDLADRIGRRVDTLSVFIRRDGGIELARSLTAENIAGEVAYFKREGRASFERPYARAWLREEQKELPFAMNTSD